MTPDEINRVIAEHLGDPKLTTKCEECGGCGECGGEADAYYCPECSGTGKCQPRYVGPRYSGDLNAMHEAEKAAFGSSTQWVDFAYHLLTVLQSADMSVPDGMTCLLQATAAQRAEAFLRTIGKWRAE